LGHSVLALAEGARWATGAKANTGRAAGLVKRR